MRNRPKWLLAECSIDRVRDTLLPKSARRYIHTFDAQGCTRAKHMRDCVRDCNTYKTWSLHLRVYVPLSGRHNPADYRPALSPDHRRFLLLRFFVTALRGISAQSRLIFDWSWRDRALRILVWCMFLLLMLHAHIRDKNEYFLISLPVSLFRLYFNEPLSLVSLLTYIRHIYESHNLPQLWTLKIEIGNYTF